METEPVPRTKFKSYSANPHLLLGIKGYSYILNQFFGDSNSDSDSLLIRIKSESKEFI